MMSEQQTTIARQIALIYPPQDPPIVWTHWKNGDITRNAGDGKGEVYISSQLRYKVNKEEYTQQRAFKALIAFHEYQMPLEEAITKGLLARHPETPTERKNRKQNWWEKNRKPEKKIDPFESEESAVTPVPKVGLLTIIQDPKRRV